MGRTDTAAIAMRTGGVTGKTRWAVSRRPLPHMSLPSSDGHAAVLPTRFAWLLVSWFASFPVVRCATSSPLRLSSRFTRQSNHYQPPYHQYKQAVSTCASLAAGIRTIRLPHLSIRLPRPKRSENERFYPESLETRSPASSNKLENVLSFRPFPFLGNSNLLLRGTRTGSPISAGVAELLFAPDPRFRQRTGWPQHVSVRLGGKTVSDRLTVCSDRPYLGKIDYAACCPPIRVWSSRAKHRQPTLRYTGVAVLSTLSIPAIWAAPATTRLAAKRRIVPHPSSSMGHCDETLLPSAGETTRRETSQGPREQSEAIFPVNGVLPRGTWGVSVVDRLGRAVEQLFQSFCSVFPGGTSFPSAAAAHVVHSKPLEMLMTFRSAAQKCEKIDDAATLVSSQSDFSSERVLRDSLPASSLVTGNTSPPALYNRGARATMASEGGVAAQEQANGSFDFDLAVVGGGSGGLATAKEAAKLGAKVVLFDYVKPSSHGTKWGLGGTCVNVGCVPKKLMHYSGTIGAALHHDAEKYGWILENGRPKVRWEMVVETIQNYIKSLNFSYRGGLRSAGVQYINALAAFSSPHHLTYRIKQEEKNLSARYIVIATGGRPHIPPASEVPGAMEFAITSDDLFSIDNAPGKTLVVGASYIGLECGGFLTELGFDVTVAVRSILLRGFDQQCAEKIGTVMKERGTKFLRPATPKSIEKLPNGKLKVTFNGDFPPDEFDTVVYATGRLADTSGLMTEKAGLGLTPNGKIATQGERSTVPNIFAVGDVLEGKMELTPVAIKAGELLARRLFGGSEVQMDYDFVPTTVFTPVEYGAVGYSEEDAIKKYGKDNVEVYLLEFNSLEASAAHREKVPAARADDFDIDMSPSNLSKLVVVKSLGERVVGFHFVGPNAGEITQGMALAVRLGAKKADFDSCVGIHPTDAESFMSLSITKSSGESWVAAGGCGGGKCG